MNCQQGALQQVRLQLPAHPADGTQLLDSSQIKSSKLVEAGELLSESKMSLNSWPMLASSGWGLVGASL
ncbi:hypothetical protein EB796_016030 [Bugula neritina]|uniref:Uncharacterized protein n=1 Tax=Bugula neritina TaxID=10212 RepID=A0A7J7JHG0_BUGNE|nr:hypothetical protein EB796_016030 [Bugula neritina]